MNIAGTAMRVRIYIGENDQWHHQPLFLAILDRLRREGCAGATVVRGIAGFGAHSRIHTATILRLSEDLPMVVEWVDRPDRVERVLPAIAEMVAGGLITVEDVRVAKYGHPAIHEVPLNRRIADVMTRDVVAVRPETPLAEAVRLLIDQEYRVLPVVDEAERVVGIVTNGDLIERGGLTARVELLGRLEADALRRQMEALEAAGRVVAEVMNREVVTVPADAPVRRALNLMLTRRLKRLPVVDAVGHLLGMISRVDLLRLAAEDLPIPAVPAMEAPGPAAVSAQAIGSIARADVPIVRPEASLDEVLAAVTSTRLNRAIVVDADRHVLGVISDAELLRRLSPEAHPTVVQVLMGRVAPGLAGESTRQAIHLAEARTAGGLMDTTIPSARADTPIGQAIGTMLTERRKILPVVDAEDRLVGIVDRSDLLRAVHQI